MVVLGRGAVLGAGSATNPLVFYSQARGYMEDLVALDFQVFDVSNDTKWLTPVQVFPASAGTWQPVDIDGADRLGAGRYTASGWTVGNTLSGKMLIRWRYQRAPQPNDDGGTTVQPVLTVDQEFEVLVAAPAQLPGPAYALVADMRAEGLSSSRFSDATVLKKIILASQLFERFTKRWFEPRFAELKFSGSGGASLLLDVPIVGVETLHFQTSPLFPSALNIEQDFYRVFNRHLLGLLQPDDRNNPRIELFSASEDLAGIRPYSFSRLIFPRGTQNVTVGGTFGYTDPDGTPMGRTPQLVQRAVQLLVMRDLARLVDVDDREDGTRRGRLRSETTRDQSYDLESARDLGLVTSYTGDPEIDGIIDMYARGPGFGAA